MTREVLVGMCAVLITVGTLGGLWHREATRGLRFELEFEDGLNLKPGDSVFLHGVDVGEVVDVFLDQTRRVHVQLRLLDRSKYLVPANSEFLIATDKLLFGKKAIVVMPAAVPGAPVAEGQVLQGAGGYTEVLLKKGAAKVGGYMNKLRGLFADEPEEPTRIPSSEPPKGTEP